MGEPRRPRPLSGLGFPVSELWPDSGASGGAQSQPHQAVPASVRLQRRGQVVQPRHGNFAVMSPRCAGGGSGARPRPWDVLRSAVATLCTLPPSGFFVCCRCDARPRGPVHPDSHASGPPSAPRPRERARDGAAAASLFSKPTHEAKQSLTSHQKYICIYIFQAKSPTCRFGFKARGFCLLLISVY